MTRFETRFFLRLRAAARTDMETVRGCVTALASAVLIALQWPAFHLLPAHAGAGVATPPAPGIGSVPPLAAVPPPIGRVTLPLPATAQGFAAIGFLQNSSVGYDECPELQGSHSRWGGTAVVNGLSIIIPCNTILQMPAAAFTWADLFKAQDSTSNATTADTPPVPLTLPRPGSTIPAGGFRYPSTEVTIIGNVVSGRHIAGLVFISQQAMNTGVGYITGFDYANSVIFISGPPGTNRNARLQLNDVLGRFGNKNSPDRRFIVDDENPTIRAATGYLMCVPRWDPATKPDPLCPMRNRPLTASKCRNFAVAGVTLPSAVDLPPPAAGQVYCSSFVMGPPDVAARSTNLPLSTEQAPFVIGDYIRYSGTLLQGDGSVPDTISVHTIDANIGIYTEPDTLPSYMMITSATISADAPLIFNGVLQEAPDRLVLDAMTTDVKSVVDIYLVDLDPVSGAESQRWITPRSMTGGAGSVGSNGAVIDGGITTQFTGPVPGRVRIRAGRATPRILFSPTRYLRIVARSLCDPQTINARMLPHPLSQAQRAAGQPLAAVSCIGRLVAANRIKSGQFLAPTMKFIFPEALFPGDPVVPNNFWDYGFLVNGEGPNTGPLKPTPW